MGRLPSAIALGGPGRIRTCNKTVVSELFENTARQVGQAAKHIQERHVVNCSKTDPAYGKGVADALSKFADGNL